MPTARPFCSRLKELRERSQLSVTELAKRCGIAESAIYKAEAGSRKVRWRTVETAYGEMCQTPYEFSDLLMQWALLQSERAAGEWEARQSLELLLGEATDSHTEQAQEMLEEMRRMTLEQQQELVAFAKLFRRSEGARRIAAGAVGLKAES